MSAFTLLSASSKATGKQVLTNVTTTMTTPQRLLHASHHRQVIMMPAFSPFMTEGVLKRWKKREGEYFDAGDILLQIESDMTTIDVEAINPGILAKILIPEGTTDVPVEQVIALVARNAQELNSLQDHTPPSSPDLMSNSMPGFDLPRSDPIKPASRLSRATSSAKKSPRRLSLYEMQMMGQGQRTLSTEKSTPSPWKSQHGNLPRNKNQRSQRKASPTRMPKVGTNFRDQDFRITMGAGAAVEVEDTILDGSTIRRMIVANLSQQTAPPSVSKFFN